MAASGAASIPVEARPARLPAEPYHRFDYLCAQVARELRADACAIRLIRGNDLELAGAFGFPDDLLPPRMPKDYGLAHQILSLERPLIVADVRAYPITRRVATSYDSYRAPFVSFAGIPLVRRGVPFGVMAVYAVEVVRLFTDQDVERLVEAGALLAERA